MGIVAPVEAVAEDIDPEGTAMDPEGAEIVAPVEAVAEVEDPEGVATSKPEEDVEPVDPECVEPVDPEDIAKVEDVKDGKNDEFDDEGWSLLDTEADAKKKEEQESKATVDADLGEPEQVGADVDAKEEP